MGGVSQSRSVSGTVLENSGGVKLLVGGAGRGDQPRFRQRGPEGRSLLEVHGLESLPRLP